MAFDDLYMDLLAFSPAAKPPGGLESRMNAFLEAEPTTESLDGAAFSKVHKSQSRAD